jgi:hypothetical protein
LVDSLALQNELKVNNTLDIEESDEDFLLWRFQHAIKFDSFMPLKTLDVFIASPP